MVQQQAVSGWGAAVAAAAVGAAVVAVIGNLTGLVIVARSFFDDPAVLDDSLAVFTALGCLVLVAAFAFGAVQLLRGDRTGAHVLAVAAAAQILLGLLALLATVTDFDPNYGIHWFGDPSVLPAIFGCLTGPLNAVTATVHHNWIAATAGTAYGLLLLLPALAATRESAPAFRW